MTIENTILRNLIFNSEFSRKVLPYIKKEYFTQKSEQYLVGEIFDFITKYNNNPTVEALKIAISKLSISEDELKETYSILDNLEEVDVNQQWLLDETEKFCKDKALYIAVLDSISIMDEKSKKDRGIIPKLLQDALSVGFDTHIGHDYIDDSDDRFEYYHKVENKIPFDLESLNSVTNGGVATKTLNILMAGVHVGKTLCLCHLAATYLSAGMDVLYITLEMAEEAIAQRIDANLLDVKMDDIVDLDDKSYKKKIYNVKSKTVGKLIIKEYPTASANVNHFNHLLNELFLKKNFKPKIIIIDYLNICSSARLKKSVGLYEYVKSISEELRGFAVEHEVVLWSATQLNRTGFADSDPGMEHTAESFGLPATSDLIWILISSDDMEELNQIMIKQEKNRYKNKGDRPKFVIGVDKPKMRIYDLEESAQEDISVDVVNMIQQTNNKLKNKFKEMTYGT